MCSVLFLEIFNEAGNAFLYHFYMLYYWLFCLWIVMHNFIFFLCSYLLGEKCEALETIMIVTWNTLLYADSRKLEASFTFFGIPND